MGKNFYCFEASRNPRVIPAIPVSFPKKPDSALGAELADRRVNQLPAFRRISARGAMALDQAVG